MNRPKNQPKKNQKRNKQHDPLGNPVTRGPMSFKDLSRQIDVAEGRRFIVQEIIMELEHKEKELTLEIDGCNEAITQLEAKPAKKK